jgi:MtN3 and saliva related transmembrane protein
MLLTFCTGVVLWFIHGFVIASLPVTLANFVTFLLAGAVLVLKLKYG